MQFKDAAYEMLKRESNPLHYNEITNKAIDAGWMFWKYEDPESEKWEYKSKLRGE